MQNASSSAISILDAKTVISQSRANRPSRQVCGSPEFVKYMSAIHNHLNHRPVKLSTPVFPDTTATTTNRPVRQAQAQIPATATTYKPVTAKRTLRFSVESFVSAHGPYSSGSVSRDLEEEYDEDLLALEEEEEEEELATRRRTGNGVSFAHSSPERAASHSVPTPVVSRPQYARRGPSPPSFTVRESERFVSRFDIASTAAAPSVSRFSSAVAPPSVSFASRFSEPETLASRFRSASISTFSAAAPPPEPAVVTAAVTQDTSDADAEFARQLMEAEEQEFLERLHNEQSRALAQLRNAGDGGESWLNNISQEDDGESDGGEGEEEDMSYERMLEIGETLGDVKTERWRERSAQVLAGFVQVQYRDLPVAYRGTDMCVICQFAFETEDEVKLMPNCTHCFHPECTDAWIKDHSACATCKALVE
ncbi:hypothetical protein BASA81_001642 [Batrachochytrium salamandrivorans]|nr:hypothetical protein BASA81_001642 [Batrachochytrium salamandrivorans]